MTMFQRLEPRVNLLIDGSDQAGELSAPVGAYVRSARLEKVPTIGIAALGMDRSQLRELGQVIFAAQRISAAFRPVIIGDDLCLQELVDYGWAIEHIPNELRWDPSDRNRVWEDLVYRRVAASIRWYGLTAFSFARANSRLQDVLGAISAFTGVDLYRTLRTTNAFQSDLATGYSNWVPEVDGSAQRTLVLSDGQEAPMGLAVNEGAGIVVIDERAPKKASLIEEAADLVHWSVLRLRTSDLESLRLDRLVHAVSRETDRPTFYIDDNSFSRRPGVISSAKDKVLDERLVLDSDLLYGSAGEIASALVLEVAKKIGRR